MYIKLYFLKQKSTTTMAQTANFLAFYLFVRPKSLSCFTKFASKLTETNHVPRKFCSARPCCCFLLTRNVEDRQEIPQYDYAIYYYKFEMNTIICQKYKKTVL